MRRQRRRSSIQQKSKLSRQRPEGSKSATDVFAVSKGDQHMGELEVEKHANYILSVEKKKDDFESVVMEHLRINGAYWGLTTLDLLGKIDEVNSEEVVSWVMKCQHESGGFGGNIGHDPHLLYTLSAIQVLALFDKTNILDIDKTSLGCRMMMDPFQVTCGVKLIHAVKYIVSCKNLDGGFGCTPGAESHAGQREGGWGFFIQQSKKMKIKELAKQIHGRSSTFVALIARLDQVFCCVGALAITGSLHHIDKNLLGWWLCERQVKSGGLNGRPEKLPDVCYSWWVLSSLIIIDRVHWIDKEKLVKYILDCQDKEKGGISDRPDDAVDVFHTYFGVAGLSLLEYPGLKAIDPAYALPVDVVNRIFFDGKFGREEVEYVALLKFYAHTELNGEKGYSISISCRHPVVIEGGAKISIMKNAVGSKKKRWWKASDWSF
ncbi:unnamed protein product [Camellia sinensis]